MGWGRKLSFKETNVKNALHALTHLSENGNDKLKSPKRTYILLDVLLCSIAEYFYESKYKRVKILSDTTLKNVK